MKIRCTTPGLKSLYHGDCWDQEISFVDGIAEVPNEVGKKLIEKLDDIEEVKTTSSKKRED